MICPQCDSRYPRGFSRCTHCEVALVDEAAGGSGAAAAIGPEADPAASDGAALVCPECGGEYVHGITRCADCEVPLVRAPAAPAEHPEPELVKLTEVSEPSLLPILVGLLESSGIEPVVEGDEIIGLLPVGKPFAGWTGKGRGLSAVIRVAADRVDEARALLADVEQQTPADEE